MEKHKAADVARLGKGGVRRESSRHKEEARYKESEERLVSRWESEWDSGSLVSHQPMADSVAVDTLK